MESAHDQDRGAVRLSLAALVVGLALHWSAFKQYELPSILGGTGADSWAMLAVPAAVAAGFAALATLAVIRRRAVEAAAAEKGPLLCALSCLGTLGYLLLKLASAGAFGPLEPSLTLLASMLVAVGYASATFGFMDALVRRGGREAIMVVAVSYLLSAALAIASYLPGPIILAVTAASPVVCGACLLFQRGERRHGVDWSFSVLKGMPLLPPVTLGLFIVVARVAIGTFNNVGTLITPAQRLITLGLLAAVSLWLSIVLRNPSSDRLEWMLRVGWITPSILAVAGVFLLVSSEEAYVQAGLGALGASLDCLEMFLLLNLMLSTIERRASSVLVFSLAFTLFKMLPLVLGKVAVPLLVPGGEFDVFPMALAMLLIMVTAAFAFLTSEVLGLQASIVPSDLPVDPRGDTIEELTTEFGLTAREAELLDYLTQGYSFQAIADALGITVGTAQSYSKTLYRKLEVHAKQGLVEMVHERLGRRAGGASPAHGGSPLGG